MKTRHTMYVAGVLLCLLSASAMSQEWIDVKDPKELRTLVSNKTVKGLWNDGKPFVSYNREDGAALRIYEGQRIQRRWEIKGADQYCITEAAETYCYRVQRHANRNEIRVLHESGFAGDLVVEDGVPQF